MKSVKKLENEIFREYFQTLCHRSRTRSILKGEEELSWRAKTKDCHLVSFLFEGPAGENGWWKEIRSRRRGESQNDEAICTLWKDQRYFGSFWLEHGILFWWIDQNTCNKIIFWVLGQCNASDTFRDGIWKDLCLWFDTSFNIKRRAH